MLQHWRKRIYKCPVANRGQRLGWRGEAITGGDGGMLTYTSLLLTQRWRGIYGDYTCDDEYSANSAAGCRSRLAWHGIIWFMVAVISFQSIGAGARGEQCFGWPDLIGSKGRRGRDVSPKFTNPYVCAFLCEGMLLIGWSCILQQKATFLCLFLKIYNLCWRWFRFLV